MLHSLYAQLGIVALVLCCGLAIWKGAPAERAGAALVLVTWAATLIVSVSPGRQNIPAVAYLASDAVLAAGLLILAVRYSNWWIGAAMLLQAVGLSLHAAYFAADKSEISWAAKKLYIQGMDVASGLMLLVILVATVTTMLKRDRVRASAKADPSPLAA
jgi:hypothetical protein